MLQFSNPAALWFLALIIPVILLYLLKRKRQDYVVPSTFLWKQVLDDSQAYTPFQRLRSSLLMLLQILIIVLFTALLAQPYFAGISRESRKWILIMDRSASMQATDEKPSRFEKAKEKIASALKSIPPVDEIMLVSAGSDAAVLQNFTSNHEAISRKLTALQPEDTPAGWGQVFLILKPLFKDILKPLFKDSPKPVVLIASDFANFQLPDAIPFSPLQVGTATDNIAITKASLENSAPDFQNQMLYFQVRNFSSSQKQIDVEVTASGDLLNAFMIPLDPQASAEKTMAVNLTDGVPIRIQAKNADSFSLDNDFVLISHPRKKIEVTLAMSNPFLQRAVSILPSINVTNTAPIVLSESLQPSSGIYFLKGDIHRAAPIVQWNQAADPLRFVDAGLWQISNYRILDVPPGGQPLLETPDGVVAYSTDSGNRRQIVVGFQILDSNLPLLSGFPIFIQNSLVWIDEGFHPQIPTITDRELPKEGKIADGKGYVNFADEKESNLTPQKINARSKPEHQIVMVRQDFSHWFLIALIATVMLEWWAFHRRG